MEFRFELPQQNKDNFIAPQIYKLRFKYMNKNFAESSKIFL